MCAEGMALFFSGSACVPGQHALTCKKSPLPALSHAVGMDASVLLFLKGFSLGSFRPCWRASGEHWLCASRPVVARAFGALGGATEPTDPAGPLHLEGIHCHGISDEKCKVLCFSWNIIHSCLEHSCVM